MKKNLQLLAFIFILVASLNSFAQPTITATGLNAVIGDQFTSNTAAWMSPGNAGANQTWDLSTLVAGTTTTVTAVATAATPYATSFPNANLATYDGNTTYGYYKTSSTSWQNMGAVVYTTATTIIPYYDTEDLFHYPFTYNSTFTDPWSATFTS